MGGRCSTGATKEKRRRPLTLYPFRYTFSPVSATSPLRLLASAKPERARAVIRGALKSAKGHRGRAADKLAPRWLPASGSTQSRYFLLWKTIVSLGMGDEVRETWPAPSDPRTNQERQRGET